MKPLYSLFAFVFIAHVHAATEWQLLAKTMSAAELRLNAREIIRAYENEPTGWTNVALFNVGYCYTALQAFSKANAIFAHVLAEAPHDSKAMSALGTSLFAERKFDEAIVWLRRASVAGESDATILLGGIYVGRDMKQELAGLIPALLRERENAKLNESQQLQVLACLIFESLSRSPFDTNLFWRAIDGISMTRISGRPDIADVAIMGYEAAGRPDLARKLRDLLAAGKPTNAVPEIPNMKSVFSNSETNAENAKTNGARNVDDPHWRRATIITAYERDSSDFLPTELSIVAHSYVLERQFAKAAKVLREYTNQCPTASGGYLWLGTVELLQTNYPTAIAVLQRSWSMGDSDALMLLGGYREAAREWDKLETLVPNFLTGCKQHSLSVETRTEFLRLLLQFTIGTRGLDIQILESALQEFTDQQLRSDRVASLITTAKNIITEQKRETSNRGGEVNGVRGSNNESITEFHNYLLRRLSESMEWDKMEYLLLGHRDPLELGSAFRLRCFKRSWELGDVGGLKALFSELYLLKRFEEICGLSDDLLKHHKNPEFASKDLPKLATIILACALRSEPRNRRWFDQAVHILENDSRAVQDVETIEAIINGYDSFEEVALANRWRKRFREIAPERKVP